MPSLMSNHINRQQRSLHFIYDWSMHPTLLLPGLFRIAAHDLDLLRCDIVLIVELEVDIFDEKRPDFVAEAVSIQVALRNLPLVIVPVKKAAGAATLKFMRALTFSANTSVMDLSKVAMTFMAV